MELTQKVVNVESLLDHNGEDEIELSAGQRLQIRTGTAGDITSHLDEECPAGKKWIAFVQIKIHETNA